MANWALAARRDVWSKGQPCTYCSHCIHCRETCTRLKAAAAGCRELQGSAMNLRADTVSCREVQGFSQWTLPGWTLLLQGQMHLAVCIRGT